MQRHGLQPGAYGDQTQARPGPSGFEEFRHADGHEKERPVIPDHVVHIADMETLQQKECPHADEENSPEKGVRIDWPSLFIHVVHCILASAFLTSMPAMNIRPRTMSCRPPRAAVVLTSIPPITGTTSAITSHPGGTRMSMPPHTAMTSTTTGPSYVTGSVSTNWCPPMNASSRLPDSSFAGRTAFRLSSTAKSVP